MTTGLVNGRLEKEKPQKSKEEQIAGLQKHRQQVVNAFFKVLNKDRGDGQGTHLENPNEKTFKLMQILHNFAERRDSELNRLEGKEMVPFKRKDGTVQMVEPKRWYDDKLGLDKLANIQSEARSRYEERLIESYLAKGIKSDKPEAIFMMGGPASGKSTLIKTKFGGNAKGFVVVDPDDVKRMLPEFLIGLGQGDKDIAGKIHGTSARIATEILRRASERGLNILMDGTGANISQYKKTIKALKGQENPYFVQILAQHVGKEQGIARAVLRAELPLSMEGGRYVPPHFIESAYQKIPSYFLELVKKADKATLNNGETDKIIAEFEGGKVVNSDNGAMERYIAEAKGS